MDIDKGTFDRIFGFEGKTAEEVVLDTITQLAVMPSDMLFSSLQIYESGLYLSKNLRTKPNFDSSIVMENTFNAVLKIFKLLDEDFVVNQDTIYLYPDEILKVERLFINSIQFFEDKESYENCALLLKVRDLFFTKIKPIK